MVKDYISQKELNTRESKLMQILVGNVKLMILCIKLNRANALFLKIKYACPKILRLMYFAIFESHLSRHRILELFNRLWFYKKKGVRVINFQPRNFHTSPLFKESHFLRFRFLENILFISKSVNSLTPSIFYT